jgi:hypothetical protein
MYKASGVTVPAHIDLNKCRCKNADIDAHFAAKTNGFQPIKIIRIH